MNFLSVCSGIECASQAWNPLGWRCVAVSEIEKFPSALLAHHYPDVPNLGDMTKHNEWPDDLNPELLVGGTPCQSFSVAGLRKGLDDARGNLMLAYADIARRYRPRWLVWENVPGVLSSDRGQDFASLLGILTGQRLTIPQEGWQNSGIVPGIPAAYGLAWRVLDAQHFGVPQRRRRVFLVGYLGDYRRAAAVLLERHSLQGHPAPSRKKGQGTAPTLSSRPSGGGGLGTDFDLDGGLISPAQAGVPEVAGPMQANGGTEKKHGFGMGQQDWENGYAIPTTAHTLKAEGFDASEDGTGRGIPLVMAHGQGNAEIVKDGEPSLTCNHEQPILVQGAGAGAGAMDPGGAHSLPPAPAPAALAFKMRGGGLTTGARGAEPGQSGGVGYLGDEHTAFTLSTTDDQKVMAPVLGFRHRASESDNGVAQEDLSPTLRSGDDHGTAIAYNIHGTPATSAASETDTHSALRARAPGGSEASTSTVVAFTENQRNEVRELQVAGALSSIRRGDAKNETVLQQHMAVRRLTPRECERLQGYADDYTLVPFRGKPAADGPRYKAIGNGMAVPVMRWLGERIAIVDVIASRGAEGGNHGVAIPTDAKASGAQPSAPHR